MKSILFDVDGVFLSEERCFDVSALTVEEILKGKQFLNLDNTINFNHLSDDDIVSIRQNVFQHDRILKQLKSLGLNSNWDMLFIVLSIHFIDILKTLDQQVVLKILEDDHFSEKVLQEIQTNLDGNTTIEYDLPLVFISNCQSGKENIYADLEKYAMSELKSNNVNLFKLKGPLWQFARNVYQEWYLGSQLFEQTEDKMPISSKKSGFIYDEKILRPIEEIKTLLDDLQNAGYQLAIATGRPETETLVPFKALGIKKFFENNHIVTASDVLNAESAFPEYVPLGKPNPFCYIATLRGNEVEDYEQYINEQNNIVQKEDVYIVGDSLADLLCAKTIGATFIGTLTGLKEKDAREELQQYDADYIVDNVSQIRDILL